MSEYRFFQILLAANFLLAAVVFLVLMRISAPYGRHARRGWGPLLPDRLGWLMMEAVSPVVMIVLFAVGDTPKTAARIVFLTMWEAHYLYRAFVYPHLRRSEHHEMPLTIPLLAAIFNLDNTYINGRYLFHFAMDRYTNSWLVDPRFLLGAAIFAAGYAINHWADAVLRNLRTEGETGYKIPYGGLYRYISSPNYFGEIVEWLGWAMATWSLAGLSFAVWTIANLAPRARSHQKWYHEHFDSYPPERKALIPWIW